MAVLIGICVSRSEGLATVCTFGAVFCVVRGVLLTACLFAVFAVCAVVGICYVSSTRACVTVFADRAIRSSCYVSGALDGLVAVLADRAVGLRTGVRCFSCTVAANAAVGVAKVSIAVLCAGDGCAAVLTGQAVVCKCLVSVASTNVTAEVTCYIMLIGEFVGRFAVFGATVTCSITSIGISVSESLFAFLGFGAGNIALAANLVENLSVVAIRGRLGYPITEGVGDTGRLTATSTYCAVAFRSRVSECCYAFLGFFSTAGAAFSCKNLSFETIRRCLFGPFYIGEVVLNNSSFVTYVTYRIAIVVIFVSDCRYIARSGFFLLAFGADTLFYLSIIAICGRLGYPIAEGVGDTGRLAANRTFCAIVRKRLVAKCRYIARSGFFHGAVCANAMLNLVVCAACGCLGCPITEGVCNSTVGTADAADRTVVRISLVAGALAVILAFVTYKVFNSVVYVRRYALESTAVDAILNAVICVVMFAHGITGAGFGYVTDVADANLDLCVIAVSGSIGYPIAEFMVNAACLTADLADRAVSIKRIVSMSGCADSCFFKSATDNGAGADLNLVIHAVFGSQGFPFAECVYDNSYIIAGFAVTVGVACMIVIMAESGFADLGFFSTADIAESVENFSSGTRYRNFNTEIGCVGVRDLSLEAAFCTVTLCITSVGVFMAKSGSAFLGFFYTAVLAFLCKNLGIEAVSGGFGFPIAEAVYILTNGTASVTYSITTVIIDVVADLSYLAANITVGIASVIVFVRRCIPKRSATVTVGITCVRILTIGGSGVLSTANVTGEIASVRVNVCLRDSEFSANVAILITIVCVYMYGGSQSTAELAARIAIVDINVLRSLAGFFTNVTFCIAGAVKHMGRSFFADLVAGRAFCGACACIGMLDRFAGLATKVTVEIGTAVVGVLNQGLAHFYITIITNCITV